MPHTPGPWKVETDHGLTVWPVCRIRMPDNKSAANMKQKLADAQLISLAPDMLNIIRGRRRLSNLSDRLEALRQQFKKECKEEGIEQCPKSK